VEEEWDQGMLVQCAVLFFLHFFLGSSCVALFRWFLKFKIVDGRSFQVMSQSLKFPKIQIEEWSEGYKQKSHVLSLPSDRSPEKASSCLVFTSSSSID
jgi:hypothetical protein